MATDKQSFLKTVPGILTAVAAIITAVTGFLVAIHQLNKEPQNITNFQYNEQVTEQKDKQGISAKGQSEKITTQEQNALNMELPGSSILIKDIFNFAYDQWEERDEGVFFSHHEKDAYIMELKENRSTFHSERNVDIPEKSDFLIEATATVMSGHGYFWGVFWETDWKNTHEFQISASGVYSCYENEGWIKNGGRYGETKNLIERTKSTHIKSGSQVNKIILIRSDGVLRFFINDRLVNEIPHAPFSVKKLGFSIGGKLRVKFQRFIVRVRN